METQTAPSLETIFKTLPTQAELLTLADAHRAAYKDAQPFPHTSLQDVLPAALLDRVIEEFPAPGQKAKWDQYDNPLEAKLQLSGEEHWGPYTRLLMHYLNGAPFLRFLERLTGIDNLIPDPHFQGGGLHQTVRGGYLKIHADFNKNPKTQLDRRLNVLVYLNKDWQEDWGGHFEMWDREMKQCEAKVPPLFNRMAVFSTTDFSYHGLPDPISCPEGVTRKSLALYYYSNGRPADEVNQGLEDHSTLFKLRPGQEQAELEAARQKLEQRAHRKQFMKSLVPPILYNALRDLKRRGE